jgi:2-C-methyl-D-erythritol 4-phosphate cytidylyltransferase
MRKVAIIVAGGNGSRMKSELPKQFLLLKGKPILYYTLETFLESYADMEIILVLPEAYLSEGEKLAALFPGKNRIQITSGGVTRFHSVQNGLKLVGENSIVFVHDGVRCLLSSELIHRCFDTAVLHGSAIPVITSKDSVRISEGKANRSIERHKVKLVQTPQVFQSTILKAAFQQPYDETFTDEAIVVETAGNTVTLVNGEETNLKITSPVDLYIAEKIWEQKYNTK